MAASSPPVIIGLQPYEPTRDCSQGLCSMYCPQWCYFIFPPPPPFDIADPSPDDSSSHVFSPLVIAIIGVLASAFLLVTYYTFISKYCGTFNSLRGRVFGSNSGGGSHGGGGHGSSGQSRSQESWTVSPAGGLDETLINKITVCKYRRGDGFVHTTDCSVCLGEFRDGESLRLLPKCSHAFHQQCIDTWLKSHSNCPLCRSNITFVAVGAVSPEPEACAPGENDGGTHQVIVVMDDLENMCEEQQDAASSGGDSVDSDDQEAKDGAEGMEEASGIAEIREEGTPMKSAGSSSPSNQHRDCRMSIADVLQSTMEDELMAARESGLLASGAGTSKRCRGENSNGWGRSRRPFQDAVDAIPMKSASAARVAGERIQITPCEAVSCDRCSAFLPHLQCLVDAMEPNYWSRKGYVNHGGKSSSFVLANNSGSLANIVAANHTARGIATTNERTPDGGGGGGGSSSTPLIPQGGHQQLPLGRYTSLSPLLVNLHGNNTFSFSASAKAVRHVM